MRDRRTWIRRLENQLRGNIPMEFPHFVRIELMLYALQAYFPEQPIDKAHLLMQGYREPTITDAQWRILQHLRHLAPEFRSSISWEIALRTYNDLAQGAASSWLGFQINYEDNRITPTDNMVSERYAIYNEVLNQELQFSEQNYKPAPKGSYIFHLNSQQPYPIEITQQIAEIGSQHIGNIPSISLTRNREAIRVSKTDLIAKGIALEEILGYEVGQVLEQSTYWDLQNHQAATEIVIDGESEILGPTGSGKSTAIESLVTLLIEKNKRIAIATNSVGEVQDWLVFAQKVGIRAVPIIGDSERHKHLSRLNQAVMFSDQRQPFTHPGFRWLSQACPLSQLSSIDIPQSGNGQHYRPPCFGQLHEMNNPKKKYDCPLVPICPRHIKANELEQAQLIVGTLPGFILKKITPHALKENITILEYLALTTDLFIIDEVDLAQPKLDEIFYPIVTLETFESTRDTWTRTESLQHVNGPLEGAVVVPGKTDPYLELSEDQRFRVNLGIERLMYLIRGIAKNFQGKKPEQEIEKLLKEYTQEGKLFTAWSLFNHLAQQLSGLAQAENGTQKVRQPTLKKYQRHNEQYRDIFKRIQDNPTAPDFTGLKPADVKIVEKLALVSGILLAGDLLTTLPHPNCYKFITETRWETALEKFEVDVERFKKNLAMLLQLAIYAADLLGNLGKHVSTRRKVSIDIQSNFPFTPYEDFNSLLPNCPVGTVTSAQYKNRQLTVYRGIAIGRSLLSQWRSIFSIDGLAPSHLLVTSATSYSGETEQSYPFHVQLQPSLLIEPPPYKAETVAHESEFFYCPVMDDAGKPVFISGSEGDERTDNIGRMVSGLCRSTKQGKALLEQFQDYLINNVGSDRKNLLLITNSYAEAKTFYNCLKSPYKDKASFVVRDGDNVLWSSDINVPRSKLTEFPSKEKELLIAPIGAISRAVNLMHPETGEPYFGGMVIVVRQHPSPDDNQLIISGVNKETMDIIGQESVENIQNHARYVRDVFLSVPQIFSNLPEQRIKGVSFKKPLVWTLAVNLTQLIGRTTRGGRKTVIWFADAAFMPNTAKGNPSGDSEQNSVLLAVRKLLGNAINQGGASGRLITTLYGPIYYPLTRLTHFIHGVNL